MTTYFHHLLHLRGRRDRATGTMHRRDCPELERLDASLIEDAAREEDVADEPLRGWHFPRPDDGSASSRASDE